MVLPGREHEEAALGAGVELLAVGLREGSEAVLHDDDGGQAGVEGGAHDVLLAGRDGGGDEDGALTGFVKILGCNGGYLGLGEAARHADGTAPGCRQQEAVADAAVGVLAYLQAEEGTEPLGVLALHEEAAGVVAQVVEPALELAVAQQQLVVEAAGEEEAAVAVFGVRGEWRLLRGEWCLLRLSRNRLDGGEELAVMAVTAGLEAAYNPLRSFSIFSFTKRMPWRWSGIT